MAQTTDYEIANSSGLVFRGRVNEVLAAVQSNNSGATTPTGTVAYQLWYDTTTNVLKIRNASNSAWVSLLSDMGVVLGTASGNVPVLGAGGVLSAALIPLSVGERLIRTVEITSAVAAVDFTSTDMDNTKFSDYRLVLRNVVPVTAASRLYLRTSTDGGSTFAAGASDYAHASNVVNGNTTQAGTGSNGAAFIQMTGGDTNTSSGAGISGEIFIAACGQAENQKVIFNITHWRDTNIIQNSVGGGIRRATADVDGLRILMSTGNIAGRTDSSISLYGVVK